MDPISAVFASYMDLVSAQTTGRMTDMLGTQLESRVVEHSGIRVPYAYQLWQIRQDSVCASYRQDLTRFAPCTRAAQSLFQDTCSYLQANPQQDWQHAELTNMYCEAAVYYRPTTAEVQWTKEQTPLDQARAACNLAIAQLLHDPSPENRQKKAATCGRYDALKGE